jgi:hypothetical protein
MIPTTPSTSPEQQRQLTVREQRLWLEATKQLLPEDLPSPLKAIVCDYLDETTDYTIAKNPLNLDERGDLMRDSIMQAVKGALISTGFSGFIEIKEKILANAFADSPYPKYPEDYKIALNKIFDEIRREGYEVDLRGIVLCLPEQYCKDCVKMTETGHNFTKSKLDLCGLHLCSTSIGKTPGKELTVVFGTIESVNKRYPDLDLHGKESNGRVFFPKKFLTDQR